MKWIACALLMGLPALAAAPDDITGAWTFTGEVQGIAVVENCTFTLADTALTGSCVTESGKYDTKGKVDGKTISFSHGGKYNGSDFVIPTFAGSFNHVWEQVGAAGEEAEETLQLSGVKSIAGEPFRLTLNGASPRLSLPLTDLLDATEQLAKTLSLQPLEGTDVPVNTSTHTLKMYGKTISGGRVAANVKMAYSAKSGVTTKISVRSDESGVAALIIGAVA